MASVKQLFAEEEHQREATEVLGRQQSPAEGPLSRGGQSAVTQPARTPGADKGSLGSRYMRQQDFDAIVERLRAVAHQAAARDDQAMDRLRAELDAVPWLPRMLGDLNRDIEEALIQAVAADDPLKAECIRRRASELRGKLCQANAAVLTKLAVGRVVSAWLLVQFAELRLIKDPDAPRITKQLDHLQCSYTQALRARKPGAKAGCLPARGRAAHVQGWKQEVELWPTKSMATGPSASQKMTSRPHSRRRRSNSFSRTSHGILNAGPLWTKLSLLRSWPCTANHRD